MDIDGASQVKNELKAKQEEEKAEEDTSVGRGRATRTPGALLRGLSQSF